LINISNINLGLILGSGVDLDQNHISSKEILKEDNNGIHNKVVYTCNLNGTGLLVFKGRQHFYEGHSFESLTSGITLASEMGVKNILITNAAGGLNGNFEEGDLMLINSHINFLDKINHKRTSFPYSKDLKNKFLNVSNKMKVKVHEGVYGYYPGPAYETCGEIRFQKKIGLDAAGMSTIPEVYAARELGINVIAVSVITNLLKENIPQHTSHDEVLLIAKRASEKLNSILPGFVSELN
jgi:purine-nucleoside phosphorylase